MPPTCTICRHPNVRDIDRALVASEPSRAIASRLGLSRSAVQRHDEHLPKRLVKAEQAREITRATSLLGKLAEMEGEVRRLAGKAEKAGDLRTAVMALSSGIPRILELLARLRGELTSGVQVNIGIQLPPPEKLNEALMESLARLWVRAPGLLEESYRRRFELTGLSPGDESGRGGM